MKFVAVLYLTLLSLATGFSMGASVGSPVEKIVTMLKSMNKTIAHDGEVEEKIYNRYACWCEQTAKRKADDIVAAAADLRALGQRILKLKGKVATANAELKEMGAKLSDIDEDSDDATSIRKTENKDYMGTTSETKRTLASLEKAIATLLEAEKTKKGASLLQEAHQTQIQVQLRSAVEHVIAVLPAGSDLSSEKIDKIALLNEFTEAHSGYSPQASTILGILSDMYTEMAADLEKAFATEGDQNSKFEQLDAALSEETSKIEKVNDRNSKDKAESASMQADTTKAYDGTEQQMKADTEFFDKLKAACESKQQEWDIRKMMRERELNGIAHAIRILTSDESRKVFSSSFGNTLSSFLQIGSDPFPLAQSAYNALKEQVRKTHNIRLASLAVSVRTAKAGHFGPVMKAINDMMKTLTDEGTADLDKRDQCLSEYQKITRTVNKLDWKIENNNGQIDKFDGLIELRTKEKEAAGDKMKETVKYIKDLKAERKREHDQFLKAKKDDLKAIDVLVMARDSMSAYYYGAPFENISFNHSQYDTVHQSEDEEYDPFDDFGPGQNLTGDDLGQGPTYDVASYDDQSSGQNYGPILLQVSDSQLSPDYAPETTFSGQDNHKTEANGVIGLFCVLIQNVRTDLAESKKAEAQSHREYEEELATAESLLKDLKEKSVTLQGIIAKRIGQKDVEGKDKKANVKDRDTEITYKKKITPDCDWIIKTFDDRAEGRAAEMEGLSTAKEYLAGRQNFLQKPTTVDDHRLSRIRFLGAH